MWAQPKDLDGYINNPNDALRNLEAIAEAFARAEPKYDETREVCMTDAFRNEVVRMLVEIRAVLLEELESK